MKFDIAENAFVLIVVACLCGGGFYIGHLQNRLADEVDARQAADARAALCEGSVEAMAREAREREEKAQQALQQAQKDAKTAASNAKPAALPSVSKTNAPAHLGTVHVAEAVKGSFEGASPDKPTIGAAQKATGLGPEEQIGQAIRVTGLGAPKRQTNSTAAGLAALIAGQKKARP